MNRAQKRKEAKKNKKIGDSFIPEKTQKSELNRLLTIAFIVILIFTILYFAIGLFVTKEIVLPRGDKNSETEITTNPNNILASTAFDQKEETYYVYFHDFNNETKEIAELINDKLADVKVYNVDTSDILNKNYIVEKDSNKNAKKLEELKVKKDTIIKINNSEIVSYFEGQEEISNGLN